MAAMDAVNREFGWNTLRSAAQGGGESMGDAIGESVEFCSNR